MRKTKEESEKKFTEISKHKEEIEELYYDHKMDVRGLAKRFGIGRWQMQSFMKRLGIEIHKVNEYKQNVADDRALIQLFNECIPVRDIAKQLKVGDKAVYRRIKELGLTRPKSMKSRKQYDNSHDSEIIKLYKNGMSSTEIAKIVGISHNSVLTHLKHCGVERRTLSQSQFNYNKKEYPQQLKSYETMYDMYVIQRMSKKDIALQFNISTQVVDRVLKEFNIHIRGYSEGRVGLYGGAKHPNWKGGRTNLYMRLRSFFQTRQAKEVCKRDNFTCQLCGSHENLQVHHIRPFKEIFNEILLEHSDLDIKDNINELYDIMSKDERIEDLNNLITYCKECHLFKIHGYKHKED